jgi:hypothetical protein
VDEAPRVRDEVVGFAELVEGEVVTGDAVDEGALFGGGRGLPVCVGDKLCVQGAELRIQKTEHIDRKKFVTHPTSTILRLALACFSALSILPY